MQSIEFVIIFFFLFCNPLMWNHSQQTNSHHDIADILLKLVSNANIFVNKSIIFKQTRINMIKLNKKWWPYINVKEYPRGNQKWTIQRNWQHRVQNTKKKHNTICVGHHYAQTNTNNIYKTWALILYWKQIDVLMHLSVRWSFLRCKKFVHIWIEQWRHAWISSGIHV